MSQPQVSIIIPIYNVEAYLRACLDSVLFQSFTDYECLLIDDGSTDSSTAIIKEYCSADRRFRPIYLTENRGQSVARSVGLEAAKGQYIVFVDADDTIESEYLRFHVDLMMNSDAEMAMTDNSLNKVMPVRQLIAYCLYQRHGVNPSVYGKIYRAELFHGVRFRPGIIYEDLDLMPRLWEKASRVICCPLGMYNYRHRPGSSINSFTPSRLDVLNVTADIMSRYSADSLLAPAAADRFLSANFNIFLLLASNGQLDTVQANECWRAVKHLRFKSLINPKVRVKNKIGILASYLLGRRLFARIGKMC